MQNDAYTYTAPHVGCVQTIVFLSQDITQSSMDSLNLCTFLQSFAHFPLRKLRCFSLSLFLLLPHLLSCHLLACNDPHRLVCTRFFPPLHMFFTSQKTAFFSCQLSLNINLVTNLLYFSMKCSQIAKHSIPKLYCV